MNRETGRQIVKVDLAMRKFSEKMVPQNLTHDQKRRFHISSELLRNAEMFDRVITGDETCVFNMTPKQNDRAFSGKHRIHLGREKHTLLVCFFDHKVISSL